MAIVRQYKSYRFKKSRPLLRVGLALLPAAAWLPAQGQRAAVVSVEHTRLLVDSRYDTAGDSAAAAFLRPYSHAVDSVMGRVAGRAAAPLRAYRPESPLSNLLADILLDAGPAFGERPQLAVLNMGGIRASLPQGEVTCGDLLQVAPFENRICFLTLSGESLLQLFREIAASGGEAVSRGVELVITPGGQLKSARLGGRPIDPAGSYRIATISYLAEGNDRLAALRRQSGLNAPRTRGSDTRRIIAGYFSRAAERGVAVDARVEGRIRVEE